MQVLRERNTAPGQRLRLPGQPVRIHGIGIRTSKPFPAMYSIRVCLAHPLPRIPPIDLPNDFHCFFNSIASTMAALSFFRNFEQPSSKGLATTPCATQHRLAPHTMLLRPMKLLPATACSPTIRAINPSRRPLLVAQARLRLIDPECGGLS